MTEEEVLEFIELYNFEEAMRGIVIRDLNDAQWGRLLQIREEKGN